MDCWRWLQEPCVTVGQNVSSYYIFTQVYSALFLRSIRTVHLCCHVSPDWNVIAIT